MNLQASIEKDGCGWYAYGEGETIEEAKEKLLNEVHEEFEKKANQPPITMFSQPLYVPKTIKVREIIKNEKYNEWNTKRGGYKTKLTKGFVRANYADGTSASSIWYEYE